MSKRCQPHTASTDVGMSINTTPLFFATVIEVKNADLVHADEPVELAHGGLVLVFCGQGVASSEYVARVEAESEALRMLDALLDVSQLLETPTKRCSLSRGRLQNALSLQASSPAMNLVEGPDDPAETPFLRSRRIGSWMCDNRGDSKRIGATQLLDERIDRATPERVVGRCQVDQVGVMRDHVEQTGISYGMTKPLGLVLRNILGFPLITVFGEDLDTFASHPHRSFNRFVITARNRHVSAENCHRLQKSCLGAGVTAPTWECAPPHCVRESERLPGVQRPLCQGPALKQSARFPLDSPQSQTRIQRALHNCLPSQHSEGGGYGGKKAAFDATGESGAGANSGSLFLAERARNRAELLAERGMQILEWMYEGTLLVTHGGE